MSSRRVQVVILCEDDIVKVISEKSGDLIKEHSLMCKLLALKAGDRNSLHPRHQSAANPHAPGCHVFCPAIIIAGSGMCTGGRIVDHLKNGLDNPANDVFFVGYQAKGTPGRAIMEGKTPSRAGIHTLTGYSAHADQNSLVAWVKSMPEPPGDIRLVHGEPEAQKALALKLRQVIN